MVAGVGWLMAANELLIVSLSHWTLMYVFLHCSPLIINRVGRVSVGGIKKHRVADNTVGTRAIGGSLPAAYIGILY